MAAGEFLGVIVIWVAEELGGRCWLWIICWLFLKGWRTSWSERWACLFEVGAALVVFFEELSPILMRGTRGACHVVNRSMDAFLETTLRASIKRRYACCEIDKVEEVFIPCICKIFQTVLGF